MEILSYIQYLFKEKLELEVKIEEIGYECILFEKEELDTDLFPRNFDDNLIDQKVLTHYYGFENHGVYILENLLRGKWQLIGVLRDGDLIYSHIPDESMEEEDG